LFQYAVLFRNFESADDMELYGIYFAALILFNAALAFHRHQSDKNASAKESLALPSGDSRDSKAVATKFKREYFGLYALVMAADWLQVRSSVQISTAPVR